MDLRITTQMLEILKLRLQGYSAYKIARKLNLDPPTVYRGLDFATKNFAEVEKMLAELKGLGWPEKLVEVEKQVRTNRRAKKTVVALKSPSKWDKKLSRPLQVVSKVQDPSPRRLQVLSTLRN